MMEMTAWISLATVCLMGAMTPGPSLAVVLRHTVSGGRVNGLAVALSHGFGVALYAALTVLGLAVLIQKSPMLFNVIKTVSIVFLLYLAYKALTSKAKFAATDSEKSQVSLGQSLWEGFAITFVNPKLAIFFMALFSQFIKPGAGWEMNAVMIATVGTIDLLWYTLIVLVLCQSGLLEKLRRNVHVVEKVTGVALLTVAARVAF